MMWDYAALAFRNVRKRGLRSWLTMLGIFIGIAAVVSLISLGNGLQSAVTGQFDSIDPNKLTVKNAETGFGPPGSTAVEKLNNHDLRIIENVNGVDVVIPRLIRVIEMQYNDISRFSYAMDIPEDPEKVEIVYDVLNADIDEGRKLKGNDRGKVLLGADFRDENLFDKAIRVNRKISIQGESFEVVGFLEETSSFIFNGVIIMTNGELKDVLDIDDEYDIFAVQVKDADVALETAENIKKALREDRGLDEGEEDFSVETAEQSIATIGTILSIINLVVAGIAAISLIVGGVGIMNTMYTSVLERTREIGIMKAVGARNKDVMYLFLFESGMLGLAGGLIGAVLGLGFAFFVSTVASVAVPSIGFGVSFSPNLFFFSIFFALGIGTLSGILPALQASRLEPVEALRK